MRRLTISIILLLSACASGAGRSPAPEGASGSGHLVIVGGGPIPDSHRPAVLRARRRGREGAHRRVAHGERRRRASPVRTRRRRSTKWARRMPFRSTHATGRRRRFRRAAASARRPASGSLAAIRTDSPPRSSGPPSLDSIRSRYRHGAVVGRHVGWRCGDVRPDDRRRRASPWRRSPAERLERWLDDDRPRRCRARAGLRAAA